MGPSRKVRNSSKPPASGESRKRLTTTISSLTIPHFVGLSTAHYIIKSNPLAHVSLIDKHKNVAEGASRKNGYLLCPSLDYPWTKTSIIGQADSILPKSLYNSVDSPVSFSVNMVSNFSHIFQSHSNSKVFSPKTFH